MRSNNEKSNIANTILEKINNLIVHNKLFQILGEPILFSSTVTTSVYSISNKIDTRPIKSSISFAINFLTSKYTIDIIDLKI